ncbi:WD40 repeat domain-containing protein [Nostoc sp. 'Peltigera membranacea cyanobiont' 210A]|uniref:WD40 repeat domain-containing protein n=1 Tax=Nostoc sp. 'Peltigera membranacea cyanobiont' 210A TaxID=2014529 RepID=UPI00117FA7BA|nr:hypothetical protein [Nostoc sp. 'Peltigera membranacea cyanobiont' 210A]
MKDSSHVCYFNSSLKLWDVHNGKCLKTLQGANWVKSVAFSPDGQTLIISCSGN